MGSCSKIRVPKMAMMWVPWLVSILLLKTRLRVCGGLWFGALGIGSLVCKDLQDNPHAR